MLSAVDIFNGQENQNGSFLQSKRYWFQALTVEELIKSDTFIFWLGF